MTKSSSSESRLLDLREEGNVTGEEALRVGPNMLALLQIIMMCVDSVLEHLTCFRAGSPDRQHVHADLCALSELGLVRESAPPHPDASTGH